MGVTSCDNSFYVFAFHKLTQTSIYNHHLTLEVILNPREFKALITVVGLHPIW